MPMITGPPAYTAADLDFASGNTEEIGKDVGLLRIKTHGRFRIVVDQENDAAREVGIVRFRCRQKQISGRQRLRQQPYAG
jgi:hypothetical protein